MSRSDEELVMMARSADPGDRVRAAAELSGRDSPAARGALLALLRDTEDTAVAPTAAASLLRTGDDGWDAVLAAAWHSEDVGLSEGFRGVFVDLVLAGEDVEERLEHRAAASPDPAVKRGATEMLMGLGLRPVEYIPDVDEEES